MDTASIIAYLAGTFGTISFVPQVFKIWKTKSTKDISLVMFISFSLGAFLWLIFSLTMHSMPMILANAISLFLGLVVIFLKIKYK